MVGIYLIKNILNEKQYVGQSNDIQRRWKEHCAPSRWMTSNSPIDIAIHKYGKENFILSILEECSINELNEKETFWIRALNTSKIGYNCNDGGEVLSQGENNSNASLTEQDVKQIRFAYAEHKRKKDIYELYKGRISWGGFEYVFEGHSWPHIMPEVFTEENKNYYINENSKGEKSSNAVFSNAEVIQMREKYVNYSAKELYTDELKKKVSFATFQQILWGRTYTDLPIYSKKEKKWYFNGERPEANENRVKASSNRGGTINILSDEEVMNFRNQYVELDTPTIYNNSSIKDAITYGSFQKMLTEKTYKYLPFYSKRNKKWINK